MKHVPFTYRPRPTLLPPQIERVPTRPAEYREADFRQRFDAETLFFDAIYADERRDTALILAPPPFNLAGPLRATRATAQPSSSTCALKLEELDRHGRAWVRVPAGTTHLELGGVFGRLDVPLAANCSDAFRGRRVLLTVTKDNELDWIQDWIRYHRDRHRADAVLLYDNGSTAYTPEDLAEAVARLSGIEVAGIVVWPFKYGPQGRADGRFWDSDFCQNGALEHARWLFLRSARSVLSVDVDELVVSGDTRTVFERAEAAWHGSARFNGYWMYGFADRGPTSDAELSFRDFEYYLNSAQRPAAEALGVEALCPTKWAVVPARCPARAQWCAHRIKRWLPGYLASSGLSYRHFREISHHWKLNRRQRPRFDPQVFVHDAELLASYAKVSWSA